MVDGRPVALVLQRTRAGSVASGTLGREADLLRLAAGAGVPVPEVVACDPDGGLLDAPFLLTRRVDGETLGRRVQRRPELAAARASFAADCGAALARLHALPVPAGLPEPDPLADQADHLDEALGSSPAFELALAWLRAHRPGAVPPVVVHGDFRLGNLVIGPAGLAAVLDWELAHAGDPRSDLAWLCVPAWRFGALPPVGGLAAREQLWAAYEQAGGAPVDPAAAFWWEVLGTLRWGVICALQARGHLDGHVRSVELAVIGRRVAENEHDLLRMLP